MQLPPKQPAVEGSELVCSRSSVSLLKAKRAEVVENRYFVSVPSRPGFRRFRDPDTHQSLDERRETGKNPQEEVKQTFCHNDTHVDGSVELGVWIDSVVALYPKAQSGVTQVSVSAYPGAQPLALQVMFASSDAAIPAFETKRHLYLLARSNNPLTVSGVGVSPSETSVLGDHKPVSCPSAFVQNSVSCIADGLRVLL